MTALALGLVLASALAHSTWNFLLKRSGDKQVFMWWILVTASLMFIPLGVILFLLHPVGYPGWIFILATIALHMVYFVLLGQSYTHGDLSLVYPIARGMGPMLVPILAVLILNESIDGMAVIGIIAIIAGIYTISWWGNFAAILRDPLEIIRDSGTRYAILTGITIASYAIIDKRGVGHVEPFLYMYFMTLGSAVGLTPYILARRGLAQISREFRANTVPLVVSGALTFLAYGMVLTAFSLSRVSYVAPAREVGIVVGVLLGVFLLKEPFGRGRLLGSGFIVAGLAIIAISP
ncbi:MAG: hypothetical protein BZY75_00760 [SAR202 cluster bacterium Io17-Chloro-G7]|nr:MAG: hypothetical protein BZY75_00760 [SAR202 cluster bacterium Io17-Chloro-G7]